MGAVMERHAFHIHLRHAVIDVILLHLEVGNAVAKQAAGLGVFLEYVHVVAGAGELLRAGHAGGTRAHDRDFPSGLDRGRLGLDPALLDGTVGDRAFDRLDGHRIVVDVERAGGLAWRRTDAAGDLRKIIGGVEVARGFLPVAAIHQVVPVRDLVVHRTAGVAIGNAAIHAARGLLRILLVGQREDEFAPMPDALLDRLVVTVAALEFEKAGDLAHRLFGRLHGARLLDFGERAAIFERHDLAELRTVLLPPGKNLRRARRAGEPRVPRDQEMQPLGVEARHVLEHLDPAMRFEVVDVVIDALADLFLGGHRLEIDHRHVAARPEGVPLAQHIGAAAGHTGREVAAGAAEPHDDPAGHVFATMVAGAFDHGDGAGIAHGKTLAGDATEIAFALDRAVEHGVADDDRLLGDDARVGGGAHDDPSARQALADIVVGIALELEGHAVCEPRAEALAGGAGELHVDGAVGQPFVAVTLGDLAREHRARGAVGVLDRGLDPYRRAAIECGLCLGEQPAVEDGMDLVILDFAVVDVHARRRVRLEEQPGKVEALGLPVLDHLALVEHLHLADHLGEGAEAHLRHQLAHLFGDEEEEADDMLGLADEALAQHRVLRGHAYRAGVEVALAHHDAAGRDQRRGREAEFVGAKKRADDDVAPGADAAVDLHRDAP